MSYYPRNVSIVSYYAPSAKFFVILTYVNIMKLLIIMIEFVYSANVFVAGKPLFFYRESFDILK